jgi:hypothetical protein
MAGKRGQHVALLLVEGETEEELFSELTRKFHRSKPKKIKNLRGNFSVNRKIVDAAVSYANNNPTNTFDVYVCIDQERIGCPAYNHQWCEAELKKEPRCRRLIPVIAILMIESLFFLDIDGVYKFLRAPHNQRNPKKYANFRGLTHVHLSELFRSHGKRYCKGRRCENFVANLDLSKLRQAAEIDSLLRSM